LTLAFAIVAPFFRFRTVPVIVPGFALTTAVAADSTATWP
jgi:hypothetical protein